MAPHHCATVERGTEFMRCNFDYAGHLSPHPAFAVEAFRNNELVKVSISGSTDAWVALVSIWTASL